MPTRMHARIFQYSIEINEVFGDISGRRACADIFQYSIEINKERWLQMVQPSSWAVGLSFQYSIEINSMRRSSPRRGGSLFFQYSIEINWQSASWLVPRHEAWLSIFYWNQRAVDRPRNQDSEQALSIFYWNQPSTVILPMGFFEYWNDFQYSIEINYEVIRIGFWRATDLINFQYSIEINRRVCFCLGF